jgi:hypothetical protein
MDALLDIARHGDVEAEASEDWIGRGMVVPDDHNPLSLIGSLALLHHGKIDAQAHSMW